MTAFNHAWDARRPLFALGVASLCLTPLCAAAQAIPERPESEVAAPTKAASASGSALRGTTYKAATALVNVAALTFVTGSALDGGIMAAAVTAGSWAIYVGNDYLWDVYSPAPAKQEADQAFDTAAQSWRTTLKWFTYKPLVVAQKFAVMYAFTGSAATTLVWGTAITVLNSGVFFANSMAWDWYDWNHMAPVNNPASSPPTATIPPAADNLVTDQIGMEKLPEMSG